MVRVNSKNRTKISYSLLRVAWKLFEVDKRTRYYGTNEQLYEAEIHMIKAIRENKDIHVTGLADKLGVTKGAVSQITMKLQKKGMISKDKDASNLSRIVLKLTPKGETAYIAHEKLHQKFNETVDKILAGVSVEKIVFLKKFLNSIENKIDEFESKKDK